MVQMPLSTCTVKDELLNQWKEGIAERHVNLWVCEKVVEKKILSISLTLGPS